MTSVTAPPPAQPAVVPVLASPRAVHAPPAIASPPPPPRAEPAAPPPADLAELLDFVANSPDGMHQVDREGRVVWVNQAELDLLGYTRDQVVGRRVHDFHEDPAVVESILRRLDSGVPVHNQRARLRRADGGLLDVLISSNAARDSQGMLWRSRCVVRDARELAEAERRHAAALRQLTDRQRQQEAVARLGSRALGGVALQALFDEAVREVGATLGVEHVGLCCLGPDGTVSFDAGIGWSAGLVGRRGIPMDPGGQGEYMLRVRSPVVFQVATETRFSISRMVRDAGIASGMTVLVPGRDRVYGILGAHSVAPREFTADDLHFLEAVGQILANAILRKEAEGALDARVRQQAALARLGQEALARELPELLDLAARTAAETLGADFCKVLELDREGGRLVLRAGVGWQSGTVGSATVAGHLQSQAGYCLRSDRPVIVDDLAAERRFEPAPFLLQHGVVSGASVIIRRRDQPYGVLGVHSRQRRAFSEDDIAFLETVAALLGTAIERSQAQAELRAHRERLEQEVAQRTRQLAASNRELEAFSYSVSHDLRAPLRTITGYSTLLASQHAGELSAESMQLVQGLRKSAERLGRLIDDLLDLSRVQRVDLVRERVDLSALAQQALAALAAADPERKVAWEVEPGMQAEGDARLLAMLLENLLGNAWKFTRHTEGARIAFGRRGTNGSTVFMVQDNGAGLDMAYAGKLFQPFQRLHRPSEFEGTGIGLATVRRIVERHGGRVWVEGRPGAGATFYFTLGGAH